MHQYNRYTMQRYEKPGQKCPSFFVHIVSGESVAVLIVLCPKLRCDFFRQQMSMNMLSIIFKKC